MTKIVKTTKRVEVGFRARNLGLSRLNRDDIIRPAVEIELVKETATKDFLRRMPFAEPPLAPGAEVKAPTFHGFLAALEAKAAFLDELDESNYVRVTYARGENLLFLEGTRHGVWTKVAVKARAVSEDSYDAVVNSRRAMNVAAAVAAEQQEVIVGPDPKGLCIGSYSIPYAIPVSEYPNEPLVYPPMVRIAFPTREVASVVKGVLPALTSASWSNMGFAQSMYLELVEHEHGFNVVISCEGVEQTAHFLRVPHARVSLEDFKTIVTGASFSSWLFTYLARVADGEWVGIEITENSVIARGSDYLAIAPATIHTPIKAYEGASMSSLDRIESYWTADKEELLEAARNLKGNVFCCIEGVAFLLKDKSAETVVKVPVSWMGKGKQLPSTRRVHLNKNQLVRAISGCHTRVIRIGYDQEWDMEELVVSFVFESDDTNYKAKLEDMK